MKAPFVKEEEEIMQSLIDAHIKFSALERTHPDEMREWVDNFHALQDVLGCRVLRRDYPDYFTRIEKDEKPTPPPIEILKDGEIPKSV